MVAKQYLMSIMQRLSGMGNYEKSKLPTVGYANDAAETEPLLGMALLKGYRLQVDAIEGGLVTIESLLDLS
jgi:hypothetical protein